MEVIFTKNVWAFSRDQENCPYYRGVRNEVRLYLYVGQPLSKLL